MMNDNVPKTEWPDLSPYGLELVLGAPPARRQVLAIREIGGHEVYPPLRIGECLADRFDAKLIRLGFEKIDGTWIRPLNKFVASRFSSHLPLCGMMLRRWNEIPVIPLRGTIIPRVTSAYGH